MLPSPGSAEIAPARRAGLLPITAAPLAVVLASVLASCQSHEELLADYRTEWETHDFVAADDEIDRVLVEETSTKVDDSGRLEIGWSSGDTPVFALEKTMTRLALGDFDGAVQLLRGCRDELKERRDAWNTTDFFSGLGDDASLRYVGFDYEHIAVQVHLLLAALLADDPDAYDYAVQVYRRQEELIGEPFGNDFRDEDGNLAHPVDVREETVRNPVGFYALGLLEENDRAWVDAERSFARAREWSGGSPAAQAAFERARAQGDLEPGMGRVHVFYLGGRGPVLGQTTSPVTDVALEIVNIAAILGRFGSSSVGTIGQTRVPVPYLVRRDEVVPPLTVRVDTGETASTVPLMETYDVVQAQLEQSMPWILARAAARRAVKAVAANVAGEAVDRSNSNVSGLGALLSILLNLFSTATEDADTRVWSSLPAEYQVARLLLPVGERTLDLGPGMQTRVRVFPGRDSYVVVVRPNLLAPGPVLVNVGAAVDGYVPVVPTTAAPPPPIEP